MQYNNSNCVTSEISSRFLHPSVKQVGDHAVLVGTNTHEQTTQLIVDTRFGTASTLSNSCPETNTYTPAPIIVSLETRIPKIQSMRVHSCEFPVQMYQYSAALQNTSFASGGNVATIPGNNYTLSTMVDTLSSISGTGLGFSVGEHGRIIARNINVSGGPINLSFAVTEETNFDRYRLKQKLGWCIGFRQSEYTIGVGESVEAEAFFQAQTVRYVYLAVNDYATNRRTSLKTCAPETNGDVLARIDLDGQLYPFGSVLPATEKNGHLWSGVRTYSNGGANLDRVALHFCDEYGRALDINHAEFSVGLEICHH
jgi:hypothetical protein